MEDLVHENSMKKAMIVGLVVAFILLSVGVWFLVGNSKSPQNNNSSELSLQKEESIQEGIQSTDQPAARPTVVVAKEYSNSYFSIDYPADFIVTDGVFAGEGTLTSFSKGETKISVQTNIGSKMQVKNIISRYEKLGYSASPATIVNIQGSLIGGTIANSYSEKGYVFDHNGRIFRILIVYSGNKDLARERILDEMISTLVLK